MGVLDPLFLEGVYLVLESPFDLAARQLDEMPPLRLPIGTPTHEKLWNDRARLYRGRFFASKTNFSICFQIYTI